MPKAVWNGAVIAEADADRIELVEGNTYFPPDAVKREHLRDCDRTTHCPWKGDAKYYDVVVGDAVNPAAAWYYPLCKDKAKHFEGYVAFWNGVTVGA
jgi:uncharacterized protein (DUF427 family)